MEARAGTCWHARWRWCLWIAHPPKDDMFTVKPGGLNCADEELRAVGVGPGICHRECARSGVPQLEVLVSKLLPVDGLAARPVVVCEVATLKWVGGPSCVEMMRYVCVRGTCSMKFGMTRWNIEPLKWSGLPLLPMPFSPVMSARKFSVVLGTCIGVRMSGRCGALRGGVCVHRAAIPAGRMHRLAVQSNNDTPGRCIADVDVEVHCMRDLRAACPCAQCYQRRKCDEHLPVW